MPSLKDLKVRINSVKNTQKITSAMKMVAAAKLRRAQGQAEAGEARGHEAGDRIFAEADNGEVAARLQARFGQLAIDAQGEQFVIENDGRGRSFIDRISWPS